MIKLLSCHLVECRGNISNDMHLLLGSLEVLVFCKTLVLLHSQFNETYTIPFSFSYQYNCQSSHNKKWKWEWCFESKSYRSVSHIQGKSFSSFLLTLAYSSVCLCTFCIYWCYLYCFCKEMSVLLLTKGWSLLPECLLWTT
jgi:hypothetical protein